MAEPQNLEQCVLMDVEPVPGGSVQPRRPVEKTFRRYDQKQSYLRRSATGVGAARVARLKTDVTYGRRVGYDELTRRQRFSLSATLDLAAMAIVVATMPTTYVLRSDESSPGVAHFRHSLVTTRRLAFVDVSARGDMLTIN